MGSAAAILSSAIEKNPSLAVETALRKWRDEIGAIILADPLYARSGTFCVFMHDSLIKEISRNSGNIRNEADFRKVAFKWSPEWLDQYGAELTQLIVRAWDNNANKLEEPPSLARTHLGCFPWLDRACYDSSSINSPKPLPLRLITHNIRYATDAPFEGEEKWAVRKNRLINELIFSSAHCPSSFICLQEVLHSQLTDILSGLNNHTQTWNYIGVGRDDGLEAGEYSPILYQPAIWTLQSFQTLWLSKTPHQPSKSWDAASTRILTIGIFQHHLTKNPIIAMNTHLDDQGSLSRLESAKIILHQISSLASANPSAPIFLAGDFNSQPHQEAYQTLTNPFSPMRDLQTLVPEPHRYGNVHTFTGFGHEISPPTRIDFLFINRGGEGSRSRWEVKGYGVLANKFEDGVYSSDHRAVVGDLEIFSYRMEGKGERGERGEKERREGS